MDRDLNASLNIRTLGLRGDSLSRDWINRLDEAGSPAPLGAREEVTQRYIIHR